MPKEYRYQFTVTGRDPFPLDMLRYDACWPKRESEDVWEMGLSLNPRVKSEYRSIILVGVKPPTEGRWESFGWKVVDGFTRFSFT